MIMKLLVTVLSALTSLTLATATTKACDSWSATVSCRAPYRVSTCEVKRCSYCKTTYDRCGQAWQYTVTVVTYRDYYSDGSSQTYTRSYRS